MTSRGIKNNNPGNIRLGTAKWLGEVPGPDPDFCTFMAPVYGLRAIARTIDTYVEKDGCRTLADVVNRWSPPSENDTVAYAAAVAKYCGMAEDAPIESVYMAHLVKAIVLHENGVQPYDEELVDRAVEMAG